MEPRKPISLCGVGYVSMEFWELAKIYEVKYGLCLYGTVGTHYILWSQIKVIFLWKPENSLRFMESDIGYICKEPWELIWLYGVRETFGFYEILIPHH